jgi:DNA gyrase subunit A
VPVVKASQRGTHVGGLLGGGPDAPLVGAVAAPADPTAGPRDRRAPPGRSSAPPLAEFAEARQRSLQAAGVKDGDRIVAVALCRDDDHLLLAHDGGLVTRFPADEVRAMGRTRRRRRRDERPEGRAIVSLTVVPAAATTARCSRSAPTAPPSAPRSPSTRQGPRRQGRQTGTDRLLWCGVAADLHLGGDQQQAIEAYHATMEHRFPGTLDTEEDGP